MTSPNESNFRSHVYAVVKRISRGRVLSYAEVARRAGYPGAARAVGSLMRRNHDTTISCHRVVRSDGRAGEYNRGGEKEKRKLLEAEGIVFIRGRVRI